MSENNKNYKRVFDDNPFMTHNFVDLIKAENGEAVCTLDLRRESLNVYGYAHGGAIYTIADDVAGFAAHTDGRAYVTQNSNLHFLSNRGAGKLIGKARVIHRGRKTCLIQVEITADDGKLIATGDFTFFHVGDKSPV